MSYEIKGHKMAFLWVTLCKLAFMTAKRALKHPVGMQRSSVHNDEGMMKPRGGGGGEGEGEEKTFAFHLGGE